MKRNFPFGYLLAAPLLAVLVYLAYTYPTKLLRQELIKQTPSATVAATGGVAKIEKVETPSATGDKAGTTIIVNANLVNIRNSDKSSTGDYAQQGKELTVYWREDGFGEIVTPVDWKGKLIWRGCTNDPAGYGCESK